MSWAIFKQELKAKMLNSSFKSTNEFANFFTQKYDECMKRGLDLTTQNTVIKGNTELMRVTILSALETGKRSKTPEFYNQSIALLGKGAVAYWGGAELGKIPPLIPAPGTVLNLAVVSNTATNPGTWPTVPLPVLPSTSNDPYLDAFILQATIHLQTVSGFCNTISQFPPPATPGPAILPWVGFNVAAAAVSPPSRPLEQTLPNTPNRPLTDEDFVLTQEEFAVAVGRLLQAETREREAREAQLYPEVEAELELMAHEGTKLAIGRKLSVDADESRVDTNIELPEHIKRIIFNARADIGVREVGGANRGPRINQMLRAVGFEPGAAWCAAAVSAWWRQAGINSPNSASCLGWKKWAQENKAWTKNPVTGGAIVYKGVVCDKNGENCVLRESHIGIVESYNPDTGEIVTIEGNTIAKGYAREGGGVYRKVTTLKEILKTKTSKGFTFQRLSGFVIPVEKTSR